MPIPLALVLFGSQFDSLILLFIENSVRLLFTVIRRYTGTSPWLRRFVLFTKNKSENVFLFIILKLNTKLFPSPPK
jgi:hypothetical protein